MNNLRSRAWLRAFEELRAAGDEAGRTDSEIQDLLEQALRIYAAASEYLSSDDLDRVQSEFTMVKTQLMKKWASLTHGVG